MRVEPETWSAAKPTLPLRWLPFALLLIGLAVLAAPALALVGDGQSSRADFETRWLRRNLRLEHGAAQLARLCIEQATRPELSDYCRTAYTLSRDRSAQAQSWLANWYGRNGAQLETAEERKFRRTLAAQSGDDFEQAFLKAMLESRQEGLRMAHGCLAQASHVELRTLCDTAVFQYQSETEQLQAWRCAWHGQCPAPNP